MKEEQMRGGSKPNEREMMALRPCCYVKKQTAGGNRGWVEIIENPHADFSSNDILLVRIYLQVDGWV